jgi:hypothetical protein
MNAYAQTLAPVAATTASGFDPWMIGAIVVVIIAVAGFIYLKKKSPATATAITTSASTDLHAVGADILAEIRKLTAPGTTTTIVNPPAPAATAVPTPEQLAAVTSAQATLDAAKKAAGIQS